jgi:transcription elongation factor Elf1
MDTEHRCPKCGEPAVEVGRLRKSGVGPQAEQSVLGCSRCQETWEAEPGQGPSAATPP